MLLVLVIATYLIASLRWGSRWPSYLGASGQKVYGCVLCLLCMCLPLPVWATDPFGLNTQNIELRTLNVSRSDEGVLLNFSARLDLPRSMEEGLNKGVPLYFVAEADLFRERWYWRDKLIAHAARTWRLAYQPLTRNWRVSIGGLHQHFSSLGEAVNAISHSFRWKIADSIAVDDGGYYVEFTYKLDSTQLPRPLQIGLGGQLDWELSVQRKVPVVDNAGR